MVRPDPGDDVVAHLLGRGGGVDDLRAEPRHQREESLPDGLQPIGGELALAGESDLSRVRAEQGDGQARDTRPHATRFVDGTAATYRLGTAAPRSPGRQQRLQGRGKRRPGQHPLPRRADPPRRPDALGRSGGLCRVDSGTMSPGRRCARLDPAVPVQRCACGGAPASTLAELPIQKFGFGFLGDLASEVGSLAGGDEADPLQQKSAPATCSEQPTWNPEVSIPADIRGGHGAGLLPAGQVGAGRQRAHEAVVLLGARRRRQGSDHQGQHDDHDQDRATAVRRWPPFRRGESPHREVGGAHQGHEERHRDIAKRFAQRALCAAVGKTGGTYEKAINGVLCEMNKAQEALDKTEGTVRWTIDPGGTKVVDVSLAPEPSASYPC